jgi:hypothetical protein
MDFEVLLSSALAWASQNGIVLLVAGVAFVLLMTAVMISTQGDPGTRKKASKGTMRKLDKARDKMKQSDGGGYE